MYIKVMFGIYWDYFVMTLHFTIYTHYFRVPSHSFLSLEISELILSSKYTIFKFFSYTLITIMIQFKDSALIIKCYHWFLWEFWSKMMSNFMTIPWSFPWKFHRNEAKFAIPWNDIGISWHSDGILRGMSLFHKNPVEFHQNVMTFISVIDVFFDQKRCQKMPSGVMTF